MIEQDINYSSAEVIFYGNIVALSQNFITAF